MEVSVMANSQGNAVSTELAYRNLKFCCVPRYDKLIFSRGNSCVCLVGQGSRWRTARLRFTLKAVHSQPVVQSDRLPAFKPKSSDGVKLFVGLPLDVVSDCNTVNHEKAIAAGLKALKLLGVEGVELPLWWGAVEKEARGKYEWSCYLSVAEMVKKAGLKLHVSLCFHASKQPKIPLPDWVSKIGETQPSIFYKDRTGQHYKDCLSLAVDDLPVLHGKTPVQVYQEFCECFKSAFMPFMGSTITGISMGLGPDGELRYPSHHRLRKSKTPAVGEFHCYDENMLRLLKQHAEATGNPLWGLGGPHDVPNYDQSPNANTFFRDRDGSWESPYGNFFLSWYSSQLISHGNRLLSLASSTFRDTGVNVHGKVPLMYSWYKTRSHASELTAGFYNTINREGYAAVADMFMKNSCIMTLPGMDLSDHNQGHESSSPESLLGQIKTACKHYGVKISGQSSSFSNGSAGFDQIRKNLSDGENAVYLFTYQRMGVSFFSPDHFPSFTQFVRNLYWPRLHSDNLAEEEEITESSNMNSETSVQVQTV